MAPRANWKGHLRIGDVSCPVALYTAASTNDRIAFHTINRQTGHRVRRQFVDLDTGKPVEAGEQVKGYEIGTDDYIVLEPDEIAAAVPESDKTLDVSAFVALGEVDDVYFDRPYYLAPDGKHAGEAYGLIREGLKAKKVAALACTVLFRRLRTVLVRADGDGLVATTLNFDYEVRSAEAAFADLPEIRIEGEMLDLARHIIDTKRGRFDPAKFDDRYEAALAELVKAKLEGRKPPAKVSPQQGKVIDLMAALRESAGALGKSGAPKKTAAKRPAAAKPAGKASANKAPAPAKRKAG